MNIKVCPFAFGSAQNNQQLTRWKKIYKHLPNVLIQPLHFAETDLNTKRMLDLMAVSPGSNGRAPLYITVVTKVLREMRLQEQREGKRFNYGAFKKALNAEKLTEAQLVPLRQRLDALESFLAQPKTNPRVAEKQGKAKTGNQKAQPSEDEKATEWKPVVSSPL
jgi:hypothetical protein